jgi:hypothetical protein
MAVNKNFVVKNGLEVNTDLIVADTDSGMVGVGTTIPTYLLHAYQGTGIGASSVYVTGISTVAQEFNVGLGGSIFTVLGNAEGTAGIGQSVGVGTGEPAYLLDVRAPVSTGQTALYVQGDMRITGDINLDDLRLDQLRVGGISTFIGLSTFASGINVLGLGATTTTLEVTGVSTLGGTVDINNSVEVSGITTIQNTTQSSASTNGALNVDGGVGIEKNLFVGGGSEITGILTVTNSVDFNSDLDVDGHTELDDTQISGIATVTNTTDSVSKDTGALVVEGGVGIEKNLRVGAGLSVAGISTFVGFGTFISDLYVGGDLYISENVSLDTNLNILGIATIGTLDITSDATFDGTVDGADGHKSLVVGTGLSVHGSTTGVAVTLAGAGGITTTGGDFYVGGDLYINEDVILDTNLSILGIATVGTLEVTGISSLGLGVTVAGYGVTTTQLNVSGVSSVSGVSTAALFGGYAALSAPASAETKNFAVTVAAKTSNNRYSGGSSNAYYIDGIEAPFLTLTPGRTYRFTLSSSDMSSHPFRFYLEADKTTAYTTDVTSTSTYTEIIVTDTTPTVLHYQCSSHAYMGNSVQTNSNTIVVSAASTFSGLVDINAGGQADTFKVEDLTDNRVVIAGTGGELEDDANLTFDGTQLAVGVNLDVAGFSTFTAAADFNGAVDIDGHTELDDVNVSGASTFTGAADFNGAVDIDGHTELDDVNVSGASTFTGAADFNGDIDVDGHTELDNVNVAGFSTFVGFATFSDYVFIQDGLNVAGVVTATSFSGLGQIGVGSEGTFIGVGITMVDFKSSNAANTVDVDGTSGIATVTVTTGVSIGLAIALGG